MGLTISHFASGFRLAFNRDLVPSPLEEPTTDPNYGFPGGRKKRVMHVSDEAMRSAKLPLEDRDYCAHKLLEFRRCRVYNWPFAVRCKHENHAYLTCRYDDFVLRMMEYERERRMRMRRKRIEDRDAAIICDEEEEDEEEEEEEDEEENM